MFWRGSFAMNKIYHSISFFILIVAVSIHNVNATQNQGSSFSLSRSTEVNTLAGADDLYLPVSFSPAGVNNFLKHVYNKSEYAAEFLPNNFSHFIQFLDNGKKTNQPREYPRAVLKLFGKKLKASGYVNAYAYAGMLEKLPSLTKHYLEEKSSLSKLKDLISGVIHDTFLTKLSLCKQEPDKFLNDLSQDILHTIETENFVEDKVSIEQLRQSIIRFIELGLNKLVWSPEDAANIWPSVKSLGSHIDALASCGIVNNDDDLDDLYWSLITRFGFFVELMGPELPESFFQSIKDDMANQELAFLQLDEHEKHVESKTQCLRRIITQAQAKVLARSKGIVVG
jgi:hypothetical protein